MAHDTQPTGDVEIKAFESVEIKDEATGEVEAIIATLNVVDRDFEVITPDAIKSGSKVKMSSYGHDIVGGFMGGGALPVGKGAVFVEENKAVFRGKMFMSTERGRETLSVLKEMGKDQEWSFGFRVLGSEVPDEDWAKRGAKRILTKLDVFEVSPVVIGAGIGTRTVAAKEADAEAARLKAEADAEAAIKQAEQDGAATAEAGRIAAEQKAAEDATAAAAHAEELALKAQRDEAMEEYHRVQRALRRMGLVA